MFGPMQSTDVTTLSSLLNWQQVSFKFWLFLLLKTTKKFWKMKLKMTQNVESNTTFFIRQFSWRQIRISTALPLVSKLFYFFMHFRHFYTSVNKSKSNQGWSQSDLLISVGLLEFKLSQRFIFPLPQWNKISTSI